MIRPHVVVDGSNIATEGRSSPSLEQLDEAVRAFIAEHPTELITVIVDATFGHRIHEKERAEFDEAASSGELITAPAGAIGRGDAFILQVADKADATILSNDSFQEFHGQYTWLFDEGRLIGGKPVPGVGWVFLLRTPVRGPASRRSVKDARGRGKEAKAPGKKDAKKDAKEPKGGRESKAKNKDRPKGKEAKKDSGKSESKNPRKPSEPLNEPMPFIEFVGAHPVGSVVKGVVERFSSHGAYVAAGGAVCYVPLRLMGDPPPRSARDVLRVGQTRTFAVHTVDAPHRGIDLALIASRDDEVVAEIEKRDDASNKKEIAKANTRASVLATTFTEDQHAEEAPVTPAKKAARKRPAKKTTAKKATRKAPARKAAKRSPAKKATARKTTARKRTAKKAAKRAPAKRTAKKTTAKRTAKKATKKAAKRAPAKRTAKKATKKAAKRAPAKRTAKKATKKAAKRAPAKRTAKKTAKRAPAKRTAKKTTKRAPAKRTAKRGARRR